MQENDKLFKVLLEVADFDLRGLDALDERRRLGLPDGTYLTDAHAFVSVYVTETFARQNAVRYRLEDTQSAQIPHQWLRADDVELMSDTNALRIRPDISTERAQELAAGAWARHTLTRDLDNAREQEELAGRRVEDVEQALFDLNDRMRQ